MPNRNRRLLAVFVAAFSCVVSCFAISSCDTDVTVLVATERIRPGDRLTERNSAFREVPKHRCPSDAVVTPDEIEERAAKVCFYTGDIITREYLTERGSRFSANSIQTEIRASTIPFRTTEHDWKPNVGEHIDVWLYPESEGLTFDPRNLFTAEVFAVEWEKGTSMHYFHSNRKCGCEQTEDPEKISILLDLEKLMKLQLAKKKGRLRVSPPSDS